MAAFSAKLTFEFAAALGANVCSGSKTTAGKFPKEEFGPRPVAESTTSVGGGALLSLAEFSRMRWSHVALNVCGRQ
jgi:hypothetical protein